jgi:transcriptional regulator with XRE-family HTH domain
MSEIVRMLPRQTSKSELAQARATLSRRGITQAQAAKKLGVTLWHLNRVLKGHRESRRILSGIAAFQEEVQP